MNGRGMRLDFAVALFAESPELRFRGLECLDDRRAHRRVGTAFFDMVRLAADDKAAARRLPFDMHLINIALAVLFGAGLDRYAAEDQPSVEFFQLSDALGNVSPYRLGTPHIVESNFRFGFHVAFPRMTRPEG